MPDSAGRMTVEEAGALVDGAHGATCSLLWDGLNSVQHDDYKGAQKVRDQFTEQQMLACRILRYGYRAAHGLKIRMHGREDILKAFYGREPTRQEYEQDLFFEGPVPDDFRADGGGGAGDGDDKALRSLRAIKAMSASYQAGLSTAVGGGRPMRELRRQLITWLQSVIAEATRGGAIMLLFCLLLLSGCAAFRVLNPFDGVRAADAEFHGTKAGEPISLTATIAGTLDDRAALAATLLGALGHSDPLGVLLPIAVVGEAQPRYVLCVDAMAEKCRQIPINAEVSFAGRPIGPGLLWKPSRLTAANYND